MKNIAIIDFAAGNIHSLLNALKKVAPQDNIKLVSKKEDIFPATHIILPGVGAFGKAMENLNAKPEILDYLKEGINSNKIPFLGICIGMQMLADKGYEYGETKGLSLIEGEIKPLAREVSKDIKIPHMGWSNINILDNYQGRFDLKKFDKKDFYFVHSYYFSCKNQDNIVAKASYGIDFPAIIAKDNIIATQFHPEKSGNDGLEFLANFLNL